MRMNILLSAMTAALTAMLFTGCDKPEEGGAASSGEQPASAHGNTSGAGVPEAMTKTEAPTPQTHAKSLPQDFALEYTVSDVGRIDAEEQFIRVQSDKSGGFLLTANTYGSVKKQLTDTQCLKFYNEALEAGFFGLEDNYSKEEDGGSVAVVRITANGSTKTVSVYNSQVDQFDAVVAAINALAR